MAQATLEYMRGEPPSPGSAMSHARANLDSSPKFRRTTEHVRVLARELAAAETESRTLAERCGRLEAIIDVMAEQARKDARAGPAKQQVDRLEQQLREREEEAERERTAHDAKLRALAWLVHRQQELAFELRARLDAAGVDTSADGGAAPPFAARRVGRAAAAGPAGDAALAQRGAGVAAAAVAASCRRGRAGGAVAAARGRGARRRRRAAMARSTSSLYERHAAIGLENQELKRQMEEAGAEKQHAAEKRARCWRRRRCASASSNEARGAPAPQRTQLERRCSTRAGNAVAAATRRTLESGGWPAPRKFDGEEASSGGSLASSRPEAAPSVASTARARSVHRETEALRAALRNGHS